ncbi:MAG: Coenzyme F420 hydrogenase/dehydrogenase, beta subunit C-terminal domain [Faecalibacterium sp.]|jgi:coenzyme F420-reducing hydrogenase beta subunit|nr:Coenzyme F420 hydrogenase/dehydrogenase, beta subunit C-terminal domain [Faecalibacterium sp.]
MIDQAIPKKDCTGCKMCADACPKAAIRFETDSEGFWFPAVREDLCVRCGICVKRCPVLTPSGAESGHAEHPAAYAARAKDTALRRESTSGGVFGVLAAAVLRRGGCVAGAVLDENLRVRHIFADSPAQLAPLRGVKYVQSDTAEIYRETKSRLDAGKAVLFAGTTCQNAALAAYLGRAYEQLFLCDFVCHGVPSPGAFESYKQMLEKRHGAALTGLRFRDKRVSWRESGMCAAFADGKAEFFKGMDSAWTKAYLGAKTLVRPSCFACRFKQLPRVSDVTLADFWGIEAVDAALDDGLGTSALLIHSEKGRRLLAMAQEELELTKTDVDAVYRGNPCLLESTIPGAKRAEFLAGLNRHGFGEMLAEVLRPSLGQRVRAGAAGVAACWKHKPST